MENFVAAMGIFVAAIEIFVSAMGIFVTAMGKIFTATVNRPQQAKFAKTVKRLENSP